MRNPPILAGRDSGVSPVTLHRRNTRLARIANKVFELREQGRSKADICKELHISLAGVDQILNDRDSIRRRLDQYNEKLRAANPLALDVVYEVLSSKHPSTLGERAAMARWVLESSKVVGKDSPVNIFVGGGSQVNVGNDVVDAARQAIEMMQRSKLPPAPPAGVIEGELVTEPKTEENSNEHRQVNVGVVPPGDGGGTRSGEGS